MMQLTDVNRILELEDLTDGEKLVLLYRLADIAKESKQLDDERYEIKKRLGIIG